jgi:hypothetical protein
LVWLYKTNIQNNACWSWDMLILELLELLKKIILLFVACTSFLEKEREKYPKGLPWATQCFFCDEIISHSSSSVAHYMVGQQLFILYCWIILN